ncbi:glycosyl hydrolase [Lacibacter sediminis]|uniref:Glycoside hydrolase family 2 n=1 Tax=Lacibacter sediminis TaxID=2760713 RepID=A0A7G5XDB2_9BACT|nr:glycosyl hydrolase [Lacibacter sediminis]QNA43465.1 glycoside hydrolase family 2 [Lacibacter sediminis]
MNSLLFISRFIKKRVSKLPVLAVILILCIDSLSAQTLEKGFINPPDSIQTSVYWYWISDNISKEGVIKDLHAMKAAGINRAFIGNIGLENVPYGKVKMLSDEWWEILHVALKTATALNIDIGIFNSPGWSQSGGPWIKPKEAMRYLTSSSMRVKGPVHFSKKLEKPAEHFEDVKLIAYPVSKNDNLQLNSTNCSIRSFPSTSNLVNLIDGNKKTGIVFPSGKSFTLQLDTKTPFTARSISISTTEKLMFAKAKLQEKNAKGQYQTIREFDINRSNASLNVGFDPYAPIVISFRAATASSFRLIIEDAIAGNGLAEVTLSSAPLVERYSEKTFAKMHPTPLPSWNDYKWPMQTEIDDKATATDPSKVLDISKYLSADGTLTWNVPAGEWMIMRSGMTATGVVNGPASPEATGLEVDKMSRQHVEKHFDAFIGEVLKRIPEKDRTCFKVVVQDSYEMGGQNFTDDFLAEFKKRYGYDALPYLPVYQGKVVKDQLSSDRFLWDMRRMVADKVAYDYVGGLRDVSHKHGLTTWLENYGHWGFPSEFLMYGGQSDEIAGEFWSEGELGNIENRAASSCGHIYGKTKISAESNTFAGDPFSRYPASMKQRGDRFFAEGINNTLLHVYITQPYEEKNPGMNAWFGNEFNRKNTWFSQMDVYTQYLKRTNLMLQQGLNVADVAYFIGEDAPAMTGVTDPELPVGYQFDYMNAEVIEKYMTVKDGLISLPHGTQYRMMVLPKLSTMRPSVLAKIKQLIMDGAVILGPAPQRSPSLQGQPAADQQIAVMAKEIWGNVDGIKVKMRKAGKGIIMNGMTMKEALAVINCIPDCSLPNDRSIHYGHRQVNGMEIYFLSNQTTVTKEVTPQFRVTGLQPEIWEAVTGSIRDLPAYTQTESSTAVPLKLAPYESVFIVFRKAINNKSTVNIAANYPSATTLVNLKGPWMVKFDSLQRGPSSPVVFDTLMDWTKSGDDRIKYYSGTAIYNTTFNLDKLPAHNNISISLGSVTAMAKVFVNGTYAGGLWTAPYKLDISKLMKEGKNEVKIEVVNNWMNRLIGDSKLPKEERPTWSPFNTYKATSTLQPSGLFGPVKIEYVKSK